MTSSSLPKVLAQSPAQAAIGLRDLFYEAGGNAPMGIICLTPAEFDQARRAITLVAAVLPESIDLLASEATP